MSYNLLIQWKEELMSALIILVCLVLAFVFPANGLLQQFTSTLVFLLILPILYIKLILKKPFSFFGFSLKNKDVGFLWGGIMLAISLLTAFLLITFTSLKTNYFLSPEIMNNFWIFLVYELIFVNSIFFMYEFFFKGFVLFSFIKKFSYWSILFSVLFYATVSTINSGMKWQLAPALILSITGNIVAYKSRSFIYSYLMGLLFLIFFDAYLIYILN